MVTFNLFKLRYVGTLMKKYSEFNGFMSWKQNIKCISMKFVDGVIWIYRRRLDKEMRTKIRREELNKWRKKASTSCTCLID